MHDLPEQARALVVVLMIMFGVMCVHLVVMFIYDSLYGSCLRMVGAGAVERSRIPLPQRPH